VINVPETIAELASLAARRGLGTFVLHVEDVFVTKPGFPDQIKFIDAPVQFLPEH
jgi:hypothetical protein